MYVVKAITESNFNGCKKRKTLVFHSRHQNWPRNHPRPPQRNLAHNLKHINYQCNNKLNNESEKQPKEPIFINTLPGKTSVRTVFVVRIPGRKKNYSSLEFHFHRNDALVENLSKRRKTNIDINLFYSLYQCMLFQQYFSSHFHLFLVLFFEVPRERCSLTARSWSICLHILYGPWKEKGVKRFIIESYDPHHTTAN